MSVSFEEKNDYLVISIDGKLDSLNAKEVSDKIEEKLKNNGQDVVFNFENLEYISSAGLQVLLSCAKNRKSISKDVFIYKPNEMVDNVIKITGFYSFLKKKDNL